MTDEAEPRANWPSVLIGKLERLASVKDPKRADRAALAALRRGLGKRPGEAPEMFPYVVPCLGSGVSRGDEDAAYLIASLFALHPSASAKEHDEPRRTTNLGASFHRLSAKVESGSIERRFVALLNCHRDDLPEHLRHIVGLLKAHEVTIDWWQLLHDVRHWDHPDRWVQRNWAGSFWGVGDSSSPDISTEEAMVS